MAELIGVIDGWPDEWLDDWPVQGRESAMPRRGVVLAPGTLTGLFFINRYRFLTIAQFARAAGFSKYHAGEVLRDLERRSAVSFFGFTSIPGHGKTPKVYFLKRKGFEYLLNEGDFPEETIGAFMDVHQELSWSPQMYHRLRLLDLMIALEVQVRSIRHLEIVQTLIEYRRVKGTHARETTDYVVDAEAPENRIVPDGAFVLENTDTGRRGLFFLEMDMGTERIAAKRSPDRRATIRLKIEQYDRYLKSGRFARTYSAYGDFRSFTLLFVTYGMERIDNIRRAAADLPPELHPYYRFATFDAAAADFLGPIWKSRSLLDTQLHMLVAQGRT